MCVRDINKGIGDGLTESSGCTDPFTIPPRKKHVKRVRIDGNGVKTIFAGLLWMRTWVGSGIKTI